MNVGSMPFRLCLFFVCQPDEELTTNDIAAKFGTSPKSIPRYLRPLVADGHLRTRRGRREGKVGQPPRIYSAGPELLRMMGRETV